MSEHALSETVENQLIRAMQKAFPLTEEPWAELGRPLGLSGEACLAQARRWQAAGTLREVSAVLEGSAFGWDSALVAGAVPDDAIDRVAAVINAHPTVTHNYVRNHAYNLWFTISVPPAMGLERTLELLATEAGVERFLPLRRTRTFKIGVNFDLTTRTSATAVEAIVAPAHLDPTPAEQAMFRALQTPLPLEPRPFEAPAAAAGVAPAELLAFARRHLGGAVRRYVATLRHRRVGVRGNGMAVWDVPTARQDEVGSQLARAPEVSHCYARNGIEGFPYTVYSMIHGPNRDSVLAVVDRLASQTGVDDYVVLFSSRELKKCRLRYFLPELTAWWEARQPQECAS